MDVTTVKEQVTSNSDPEENTEWHNNGSQKVPGDTEDCENQPYHDMQHEEDEYHEKGENNQDNDTVKGTHTVYFSSSLYIINQKPMIHRTHFHCITTWIARSSG